MNFTFGIITGGNESDRVSKIIDSIKLLNIPQYEIIIEECKDGMISKSKNIITDKAKYENVVYLHDYIIFDENWYKEFINYGNDWQICMNQILNFDGTRYRDWTLFAGDVISSDLHPDKKLIFTTNSQMLLPYTFWNKELQEKCMYISGAYWVAKKQFMLENPLNNKLGWAQGEDLEWSHRIRVKTKLVCNYKSIVKIIKPGKDRVFNEVPVEDFKKYYDIN